MDIKSRLKPQLAAGLDSLMQGKTATAMDEVTRMSSDALTSKADTMTGPTALQDSVLQNVMEEATGTGEETEGEAAQNQNMAPQIGGEGSDPVQWVMGPQAPSVSQLKDFSESTMKSALDGFKSAPKTKETKAYLDAARDLQNELGQLGALTSLAKVSGNWSIVGMHAAGQLLEVVYRLAAMSEGMGDRGSELPGQAIDYRDRLNAGRFNFYSHNNPYMQKASGGAAGMMGGLLGGMF